MSNFEGHNSESEINRLKDSIEKIERLNEENEELLRRARANLAEAKYQLGDENFERDRVSKLALVEECEAEIFRLTRAINENRDSIINYNDELKRYLP